MDFLNKNLHPASDAIVDRNTTTSCPDLRPSGADASRHDTARALRDSSGGKGSRAWTTLQQHPNTPRLHGNDGDDVMFKYLETAQKSVCSWLPVVALKMFPPDVYSCPRATIWHNTPTISHQAASARKTNIPPAAKGQQQGNNGAVFDVTLSLHQTFINRFSEETNVKKRVFFNGRAWRSEGVSTVTFNTHSSTIKKIKAESRSNQTTPFDAPVDLDLGSDPHLLPQPVRTPSGAGRARRRSS